MRIHIIGCSGTGKTTLAQKLSKSLGIPHYDLDDIRYERKYDLARPREERKKLLHDIVVKKDWVIEGTYTSSWCYESVKAADIVVELKGNRAVLIGGVWRRFLKRKLSGSKHKETVKGVFELSLYIWRYYSPHSQFGRELKELLSHVKGELVVLHNFKEQKEFLNRLEILK